MDMSTSTMTSPETLRQESLNPTDWAKIKKISKEISELPGWEDWMVFAEPKTVEQAKEIITLVQRNRKQSTASAREES